ncbi:hypothetical protein PFLUV_G00127890, partial [Perca fluviatilis]
MWRRSYLQTQRPIIMMSENLEPSDDVSLLHPHELEHPREEDGHCPLPFRLQLIDDLSYEDVKKCYRGSVSPFAQK